MSIWLRLRFARIPRRRFGVTGATSISFCVFAQRNGLANSVILSIVLENYGAAVYPKLARLAELTEIQTGGTEAEKARAFIAAIRALNARLGLPTGFDFIRQSDYETIAKWALTETNVNYPVPVLYDKVRLEHVLNRIVLEA